MAFAVASGYTKVAVLKMGNRDRQLPLDQFPGFPVHPFHHISHRIESGGASGPPIPTAIEQHHLVDRIYLRKFKWFLDYLASWQTPQGPLIDRGFAAWTNQIARRRPTATPTCPGSSPAGRTVTSRPASTSRKAAPAARSTSCTTRCWARWG